jgi:hypothetical protein
METNVDTHFTTVEQVVVAVQAVIDAMKVDLAKKEAFVAAAQTALVAAKS